ncbi:hypothetical protein NDU88_001718 [Pleurodeles waltl]|uniref:Endonuclease/exonuclease/phosphatase domain-containing protein n=1 Tax=Pleurodeles waltl TaxID=8319 RepID=A0AAV7KZB3_PLEWA|nr:hypothetical protein NDU88_001718 [Pleurodeles waltl]
MISDLELHWAAHDPPENIIIAGDFNTTYEPLDSGTDSPGNMHNALDCSLKDLFYFRKDVPFSFSINLSRSNDKRRIKRDKGASNMGTRDRMAQALGVAALEIKETECYPEQVVLGLEHQQV